MHEMSSEKKLIVKDVYDPKKMHSLLIDENESVNKVIEAFGKKPALRGIFIIDRERKLIGVVTRLDLLKWAKYKLRVGIDSDVIAPVSEIRRYVYSTKVKELVGKSNINAYVRPDDEVTSALSLMLSQDLIDVPVVDENGRILGDLKLSEILTKILQIQQ
jgi:CBS-domain-containing membrane protein